MNGAPPTSARSSATDPSGGHRGHVPPVAADVARPLWSVMVPTFNCGVYLRDTLESVLAQDPGPEVMQIEVVDDCSTADDPAEAVRELGPDRIRFHRQPRNVGHVRNFQTCLLRARGRLVHLLHGDDAVLPGFYATMQRAFEEQPVIGAAFCRHVFIDGEGRRKRLPDPEQPAAGIMPDGLLHVAAGQPFQTPAAVVRRDVYEQLGGFDRRLAYCGEDWEMWVRIAAHYPVWYEPEPLALYRRHTLAPGSLTGRSLRTGENLKDLRRAVGIYEAYLPAGEAPAVRKRILSRCADWGIGLANNLLAAGQPAAAAAQLREALLCRASPRTAARAAVLASRVAGAWLRSLRAP
ncbi:MAG TPA: glycosyltransferase [Longimicrobiaceae bacterium]|nr:glycosyltransferase [Longimicrobiaceae bacterium]